jgi:hypothetical protein
MLAARVKHKSQFQFYVLSFEYDAAAAVTDRSSVALRTFGSLTQLATLHVTRLFGRSASCTCTACDLHPYNLYS